MGAFWDGWNRQGQINQQQALSGLQQVRGLAGLMQEAQAMQQQQAVRGLLADPSIPDEQKIPALLRAGPAGIEVAGKLMQVQKGQQEAEKARRVESFWQNEAPKYNTPAQDEIRSQALPGGLMGPALPGQGGLLQEAKPAGVDIEGLVRAGAAAGAVSPEAVFRIESDKQNRAAQREAMLENRRMQIEAQIEAARQRGEDARRIAQMQIDGRVDLARLAAGLRPPRQEPSPIQVVGPDGTVRLFNQDGSLRADLGQVGKGTTQSEKALPASAAQKLMENNSNLRKAESALALIEGKMVGGATGDKGATGWKGFLPDAVLQRVDPKGVDTRAAISDLGSMVIHDRSGAAVTAAEFPRLRPFIPQATDDPDTVKKKLARFVSEYRNLVNETADFYKESGYKVPNLRSADVKPAGSEVLDAADAILRGGR